MTMRTSYRDIFLLACCQALLLVNNASLIAMNGLVGYALAGDKAFATAGVTTFVLGSALSAMPAALWMAKVGRRRGFMTGSIVAVFGSAICVLAPAPSVAARGGGRSLSEIARQPVFVVAVLSAALGYGVMNLLMTATPLAMSFCGYPFAAAAFVIEWHVVGMYAPGFVAGSLIQRFGELRVIIAGTLLMAACAGVAIADNQVGHLWAALFLLGLGWNLMYTGGTTLLTEAYTP